MYYYDHYIIDWDKVKTIDDLKRLLAVIQIGFEPDNPNLGLIEDLVIRQAKSLPVPMPSCFGPDKNHKPNVI